MKLDTDIHNPDAHLQVSFYSKLVPNAWESKEKQRSISDSVDYIKIQIPGNRNLEIDTPAREEHKKRFPLHWAAYQNRPDQVGNLVGTPIGDWPRVNPSMAEELRGLRFHTVEAVAGASDAQLQTIGMIAGQSAFTFRDDAKRFLSVADAAAKLKEADEKLAAANEEAQKVREQHAADMADMRLQMQQFLAAHTNQAEPAKRGRKAKEEVE